MALDVRVLRHPLLKSSWVAAHGAYISDDDDLKRVRSRIEELSAELWQHKDAADEVGGALWQDEDGWWRTRVLNGACIFQNRPDHSGGAGCAFHHLAIERNSAPMETKPEICWQAPIRREDQYNRRTCLHHGPRWERRDWGGDDTDIWWWCTEEKLHMSPIDLCINKWPSSSSRSAAVQLRTLGIRVERVWRMLSYFPSNC